MTETGEEAKRGKGKGKKTEFISRRKALMDLHYLKVHLGGARGENRRALSVLTCYVNLCQNISHVFL
jgi:hypothetical protein